ncbi:MAG: hypothetical protein GF383_05920 [Candidatus Lokiarchaeota archaeon]|nr:hypothetical protein [Candidatus Lokiarchaeota archaeon]MBD3339479.1 hypothetical protein [Candidatus Lokiarchaeota archaeon]
MRNIIFTEKISIERLSWFIETLSYFNLRIYKELINFQVFLSGDSLYTLKDKRSLKLWNNGLKNNNLHLYLDPWDLRLLGVDINYLKSKNPDQIHITQINKQITPFDFWIFLLNEVHTFFNESRLGFLEMRGPYISRTSLHAIRALNIAVSKGLSPELYLYIDGIHLSHDYQQPSEFENIGNAIRDVEKKAKEKNLKTTMLACARCGVARGYIRDEKVNVFHQSSDAIPSVRFCNLNRIIERFELNHVILSPSSGLIIFQNSTSNQKPSLLVLITHSPYGSEWTFGGVSFAIAAANHGIHTDVVFIEDGVLISTGKHFITNDDKIFNIQEIIEATYDIENLHYYLFRPSLKLRGLEKFILIEGLDLIGHNQLCNLIGLNSTEDYHRRILFY